MNYPTAIYTEQRIPQYKGNPLIEALPCLESEEELVKSLLCVPDFSAEQRGWTVSERLQMVAQLSSFMLPLERHLRLAQALEVLMRQGYVGREPRSAKFYAVLRNLYEMKKSGQGFKSNVNQVTAKLSAAFLGLPGMGKTTAVNRILARYPNVIYHPELNFHQVPYLIVETPYDGASVKGLAISIFRQLDNLLPDAGYVELYSSNSKSGADTLMNDAARLLYEHGVGILIVDEIQNLENSPKNRQALMTLLVSASNTLGVPVMFVGTNKAKNILSLDFRPARRSSGFGSIYWDALAKGEENEPSEFEDFISILWRYQWLKKPIELTPELTEILYYHSQGIVDIAIKLFVLSQVRAIYDGSETLSSILIDEVARKDMNLIQPMLAAMRNNDFKALEKYQDIAPMGLDVMMSNISTSYSGRMLRAAAITPADDAYQGEVRNSLIQLGFESNDAQNLANSVPDATNALDGVVQAVKLATSGRTTPRRKKNISGHEEFKPFQTGDLRNAANPTLAGDSNFERLKNLGTLPDLSAILRI